MFSRSWNLIYRWYDVQVVAHPSIQSPQAVSSMGVVQPCQTRTVGTALIVPHQRPPLSVLAQSRSSFTSFSSDTWSSSLSNINNNNSSYRFSRRRRRQHPSPPYSCSSCSSVDSYSRLRDPGMADSRGYFPDPPLLPHHWNLLIAG